MSENENLEDLPELQQLQFPADGLPKVIDSDEDLRSACQEIASGTGPIAIDAERASSFRYTARAYLIQIRRENSGTFLIDPIAITDFSILSKTLADLEWILHAATQDLACLREVGISRAIAELKSSLQRLNPVENEIEYNAAFAQLVSLESARRSLHDLALGSL